MADFCSDFCCPGIIITVLFLLYFELSYLFFVHFLFYFSYLWSVVLITCSIGSIWFVQFVDLCSCWSSVIDKKMIRVVQSFTVCQQFHDSVYRSFEWFSSISLLVVVRLQFMIHAGRLVHPVVQLLVQLVR